MDNTPLISVIVPVYNVEKYLRECIDSVLNQTYENFEIILVDDGSTDSSGAICDEYAARDERIKVIHKENGGASTARNVGLERSAGEFVFFLDSDDWMENIAFEEVLAHMLKKNTQLTFFDGICHYDAGVISKRQPYIRKSDYFEDNGLSVFSELMRNKDLHVQPSLQMFRRSLLEDNKLRFEEGIIFEDNLFFFQSCCLSERVSYIKKTYLHRRYHEGSLMTAPKYKRNYLSAVRVLYRANDFSKETGIESVAEVKKYLSDRAMNALEYYSKMTRSERKDCSRSYAAFLDHVKEDRYFGNRALRMRIVGIVPWFIYKCFEKIGSIK